MDSVRVQSIASISNLAGTIPPEFIHSENVQPSSTTVPGVLLEVPVIDVSDISDEITVIEQIGKASREWGMFQIVNHGIPDELISKLHQVGKDFFDLPHSEKEAIAKTPESGVEGYGTFLQKESEGKKGWVDHLFHKIWPPSAINYKFWPNNPPSYREVNEEYARSLLQVSNKLTKCLSIDLGLEEHEIGAALGGEEATFLLKINYYPPCPRPDLALGVVAHTDMSAITFLLSNEVHGLQTFRDGHWYDVKCLPNALVIHIGDQLEILSNGQYKAVLHRSTLSRERTRISWPVFLEPPPDHEVGPIPKLVDDQNPALYKTKKYKDYVYCKLNKLPQ